MTDRSGTSWVRGLLEFAAIGLAVGGGWVLFAGQIERTVALGPRGFEMGLIYWPPYGLDTPTDIASKGVGLTLENSEHILVQIPWSPADLSAVDTAAWMAGVARAHNHGLTISLDWMDSDRGGLRAVGAEPWSFADPAVADRYVDELVTCAQRYAPQYLLLGVEVDFLARSDPQEFGHFVALYERTYRAVKEAAPETKVTVSFQLEAQVASMEAGEHLLEAGPVVAFGPLLDVLALSVYPCQVAGHPGALPPDYLSSVLPQPKPVGIFETGWPSGSSGEQAQADYTAWLMAAATSVPLEVLVWSSTTDLGSVAQEDPQPGAVACSGSVSDWNGTLGMWGIDGSAKPASQQWQRWLRSAARVTVAEEGATADRIDPAARPLY